MKRLGWLLVTVLILNCCNGGTQSEQSKRGPNNPVQNQYVIKYGQETAIAGKNMTVKFTAVLEDSRCPEGIQCVWEGNARIKLSATKAGENAASLELNTSDRFAVEAQYLDCTITLIDLRPYPKAAEQISIQDYAAIVEIRKP
jgi:hypothetical protein